MHTFRSHDKKTRIQNLLTLVLCAFFFALNGQSTGMTSDAIMESVRNNMTAQHHLPPTEPESSTPANQPDHPPVEIVRRSAAEMSYSSALEKLLDMKAGKQPFSLKEAVFEIENAYFENKLDFEAFDNTIQEYAAFILAAIREAGLDPDKASSRHYMLFQFMSDTISIKHPYGEGVLTHYPFQYDFEDFTGREDFTKLFVTKLMQTESGQCRSLPLLYLIMAEELDIDAWLALAPNHSYIRIKDQQDKLYNLELTRDKFVSDGFIMGSGYINAAALQSNIYMDTLGREQLFNYLLNDLNFGYHQKFGFRLFSAELAEYILERDPHNVSAIMTKGNHLLHLMKTEARELGYANADSYLATKRGKQLHALWQEQQDMLTRLGYQDMPEEAYIKWLQSLEGEAARQQRQVKFSGFQDY